MLNYYKNKRKKMKKKLKLDIVRYNQQYKMDKWRPFKI